MMSLKVVAIIVIAICEATIPCRAEWKISSFNDRMTDSAIKTASLAAKAPDHGISATIEVSCLRDKLVGGLILSIETTASFSPGRMGLVYRLDNGEPNPRFMPVNSGGHGMSLWAQPEELSGKNRIRVQLEPSRSPNLFFDFDLAGVDKAFASIPCKHTRTIP
jgi:hypothetical protein